jgi:esterase/lipase
VSRWFLLPGLGASGAMYNALKRRVSFSINFPDWPAYNGEKSYEEVALRVIKENNIADGDIIGGSSLGGMVSLEMTKFIRPQAVVLIGSAVGPQEIQKLLSLLSPLAKITPLSAVQTVAGKYASLVTSMFSRADTEFIRAMCLYLTSWRGYAGAMDNIYRIHGRNDHIIPCPATGSEVIEDAGHLVAITHAAETALFLENVRNRLS